MSPSEQTAALLAVLDDVLGALAASAHEGAYGQTPAEVAAEVRAVASALRAGRSPDVARTLFPPTGDLQEVSIANGWGEAFLALARRADEAQTMSASTRASAGAAGPTRLRRGSLSARISPIVLAATVAVLLVVAWSSGRIILTVLAGAGATALVLPAWFVWMLSGGVLNTVPLWARFWSGLRRPDPGTWLFAGLVLGLVAAVAWVARGPAG